MALHTGTYIFVDAPGANCLRILVSIRPGKRCTTAAGLQRITDSEPSRVTPRRSAKFGSHMAGLTKISRPRDSDGSEAATSPGGRAT